MSNDKEVTKYTREPNKQKQMTIVCLLRFVDYIYVHVVNAVLMCRLACIEGRAVAGLMVRK